MFGIDCADPAADVATWMIEGELYWKPLTEKGEALTKAVAELLTDTDETKVEAEKTAIRAIVEKLPYSNLSLEGWGQEDYMDRFNSPVMGRTLQTMSGMWYLHICMSDLPVLRYQRL